MDINDACKTVHRWQELMEPGATGRSVPGGLPDAVAVIKANVKKRTESRFTSWRSPKIF